MKSWRQILIYFTLSCLIGLVQFQNANNLNSVSEHQKIELNFQLLLTNCQNPTLIEKTLYSPEVKIEEAAQISYFLFAAVQYDFTDPSPLLKIISVTPHYSHFLIANYSGLSPPYFS